MNNDQSKKCQNGCDCDFGKKADELRAKSDAELDKTLEAHAQFRVDAQQPDWLERFMLWGFVGVIFILGGFLGWFIIEAVKKFCF